MGGRHRATRVVQDHPPLRRAPPCDTVCDAGGGRTPDPDPHPNQEEVALLRQQREEDARTTQQTAALVQMLQACRHTHPPPPAPAHTHNVRAARTHRRISPHLRRPTGSSSRATSTFWRSCRRSRRSARRRPRSTGATSMSSSRPSRCARPCSPPLTPHRLSLRRGSGGGRASGRRPHRRRRPRRVACRFVCSKPPPAGPKPGLSVLTPKRSTPMLLNCLCPGGPAVRTRQHATWVWGVEFAHVFRARSVVRLSDTSQ